MTELISAPAPSGGIDWSAYKGSLLILEPMALETDVKTVHGEKDAIRAHVTILTGPDTAEDFPDALVFPTVLLGQLRSNIGKKVVGRLNQGQAKAGQKPPWLLDEATADDLEKAQAHLSKTAVTSAEAPF